MAIDLRLTGGSGQFKAEFFSGYLSTVTNTLTLTPPAGKTLRLDYLSSNTAGFQVNVVMGSTTIVSGKELGGDTTGGFQVSNAGGNGDVEPLIALEPDQSITITEISAVASPLINYSYSWGE